MGDVQSVEVGEDAPRVPRMRRWFGPLFLGLGRAIIVPRAATRALVLCYHSIHPTAAFRSATPRLFSQHLNWLSAKCTMVPFRRAVQAAAEEHAERPSVAVTFDDGFADNYDYALPLLKERAIPATFFVTAGLLEGDAEVRDRLAAAWHVPAADIRPLDWARLREMQRFGMEIGGHTYSHPNLARLDRRAAALEVGRAKDILEQGLGTAVQVMAYPFGQPKRHYTEETVRVVSEAGYEYAAAVTWRRIRPSDSPFRIPRFTCTGDGLGTLQDMVSGGWDLFGAWQEHRPLVRRGGTQERERGTSISSSSAPVGRHPVQDRVRTGSDAHA